MKEVRFSEISCQHSQAKHGLHFPSLCLNLCMVIFPLMITQQM